ncbi:MAG: hypothetical protein Q4B70_11260 [Lachnospiraceae bacterium]|nr:hypothetical protein [Lachnospiraceae bacterium]
MNPWIVLAICLVVAIGVMVGLYFYGRKLQKKQVDQREQLNAAAQNMNMLIIDKKRMKLKEANLPKIVLEQTPKYLRGSKIPVVKAKIGPKIMTLICDEEIYDQIPVKTEVKAQVSGLYIIGVKNFRNAPIPEAPKKGFMAKMRSKANKMNAELADEKASSKNSKKK